MAILQACVPVAVLIALLAILRMYLDRTKSAGISWPEWLGLSIVIAVVAVIPVIYAKVGSRPRHEDVENDRALRRAFGMDESVEGDNDLDGLAATDIRATTDAELEGATKSDVD